MTTENTCFEARCPEYRGRGRFADLEPYGGLAGSHVLVLDHLDVNSNTGIRSYIAISGGGLPLQDAVGCQ